MGFISWLRSRNTKAPTQSPAGWLQRVLSRTSETDAEGASGLDAASVQSAEEWEELPAYLPVDPQEHRIACVIASAIAASDQPQSSFTVRKVSIANPEYQRVACIAAAIGAGALETSSFTVKRIYKQKVTEEPHAA